MKTSISHGLSPCALEPLLRVRHIPAQGHIAPGHHHAIPAQRGKGGGGANDLLHVVKLVLHRGTVTWNLSSL